jgi:SMC interacting uncharacterized protein involved in chromosome segregation
LTSDHRAANSTREARQTVTAQELELRDRLSGAEAAIRRLETENRVLHDEVVAGTDADLLDRLRREVEETRQERFQAVHELEATIAQLESDRSADRQEHIAELQDLAGELRSTLTWRVGRLVTAPLSLTDGLRRKWRA